MHYKTSVFYKIIILVLMVNSCKSQEANFRDLSTNILGKHIDNVVTPEVKLMLADNRAYGLENDVKTTAYKGLLNFNGINLYGYVDENSDYQKNKVRFHYAKKDGLIALYQIYTYQTEKSEQLIKALDDFLGKPNFIKYETPEKRVAGVFEAKIWHDQTKQISYLLDVEEQDQGKACWLFIVNINDDFYYDVALSIPSFKYWEKYTTFKKLNNMPDDYTYKEYMQEEIELGDELIGVLTDYN